MKKFKIKINNKYRFQSKPKKFIKINKNKKH